MRLLLFFLFPLLFSCSLMVAERPKDNKLIVNCPSTLQVKGFYCKGDIAYSDKVQSGSKVKIESLLTGKSIRMAVFRKEGLDGICVPDRFKNLLGPEPFPARLEVQRCGIDDRRYCPTYIRGLASYYGDQYHERKTPYGVEFDKHGFYAASPDLPLGTLLRVRNLKNNKEIVVKVIDRGPFKGGRVLDLSEASAKELDMLREGVVEIYGEVLRCGD